MMNAPALTVTTPTATYPILVGSGLLKTLPEDDIVCLDLEAGLKSVQDWKGASISVRSFADFRDLAVLIGGADPAQDSASWYSASHFEHVRSVHRDSGIETFLATKSIVFVDSITEPGPDWTAWTVVLIVLVAAAAGATAAAKAVRRRKDEAAIVEPDVR